MNEKNMGWSDKKVHEKLPIEKLSGLIINDTNPIIHWAIFDLDFEGNPEVENFNKEINDLIDGGGEISQKQYYELRDKQKEIIKQLKKK